MHLSIRISEPERLFSRRCPESPSNYRPVSRADDMRVYFAETNLIGKGNPAQLVSSGVSRRSRLE
jgi:hypothetical protein